jgi:hypothetical protein
MYQKLILINECLLHILIGFCVQLKDVLKNVYLSLLTATIPRERTNVHRNRGILTVGLKNKTVEIVGIIFPHPQSPKPTVK